MKHYRLCFLGFGNVGRTLARLLVAKRDELRESYEVEFSFTGVATRRMGWLYSEDSLDAAAFVEGQVSFSKTAEGIRDWLANARPDVVFETTSLVPETGQPAIDYLRASLEAKAHTISANKAPIVYAFDELDKLAKANKRRFFFESAVLDSAPVFSLFRETLPLMKVRGFNGIFNSTTNVILETMEQGRSFDEGVKMAQELGVAETDPANDIDGWDATMKVCAIARVILRKPLLPSDVLRESIRGLTAATAQSARAEGKPYKMLARARVNADGSINAFVRPEQIALSDPLGSIRGTSLAVHFESDMIPGLTVISHRPNLQSTAYGLLADFVNATKGSE